MNTPFESPISQPHELAGELAALAQTDPLVASVSPALNPDTVPLFFVGLSDLDVQYGTDAVRHRRAALRDFTTAHRQLYVEGIAPKRTSPQLPAVSLPRRRYLNRSAFFTAYHAETKHLTSGKTLERVQTSKMLGLRRSEALGVFLPGLQYIYSQESPPVWEPEELIPAFSERDATEVFGQPAVPPDLTFEWLAEWLREANQTDLTCETLDARFNTFLGIANLEISRLILEDLGVFAQITSGSAKKAKKIATDHQQDLLGDNLLRKQQIIGDVTRQFADHAKVISDGSQQQVIRALNFRLHYTSINLDEFLQFFSNVYTSLGYELPPFLRDEEDSSPHEQAPAMLGSTALTSTVAMESIPLHDTPSVVEPESAPRPEPNPEIVNQIATRTQALSEQVDGLTAAWRLTNKATKQQGLDPLVRELTDGFRNPLGGVLLTPIPRDRAVEVVGILAAVNRLAARLEPEEVRQHITEAARRREELLAESSSVRKLATDNEITAPPHTSIPDVKAQLQRFADNWNTYRQLILKEWPAKDAVAVSQRIAQVLNLPA